MHGISRRAFLEKCGLGALAAGLASASSQPAEAAWADIPPGVWPAGYQPKSVLEIFCYGGLSPWDNFWVSEDTAAVKNWRNFQPHVQNLNWHSCPDIPDPKDEVNAFATIPGGPAIFWGPATKPLWRSDIFNRAAVAVKAHDLQPHEASTPLNLCGHRLGHPRMSGLGSKIQHRYMELAPRSAPYSFVLAPDNIGQFAFGTLAAMANGMHPGSAQPMLVRIGDPAFTSLLLRDQMTPEADELIRTYQAIYRDHLRFHGMEAIRSAGFASYDTAINFLLRASELHHLLSGDLLQVRDGRVCGTAAATEPPREPNRTRTALEAATRLLTTGGARYVCVFDGGITGSYDTHGGPQDHITQTSSNVFNLCAHLAAQIDATGLDPTKLQLDDTLIVINTEFGRTPEIGKLGGRDHWASGYPTVLIGGPITGRKIRGRLNADGFPTDRATDVFSPTDIHGAVLLAAGVNPFAPENFGIGDFTDVVNGSDHQRTLLNLKTKVLGVA